MGKPRESNLELLRILAMLFIVMHHFAVHGGGQLIQVFSANHVWTEFLALWGKLGVNLFILITGFFYIKSFPKISSVLLLWLTTLSYSIILYLVFVLLGRSFNPIDFIKVMFPVTFTQYWFISSYVALILLVPFLNVGLQNLSKKQYEVLLLILCTIWSVIPSLVFLPSLSGNKWYFSYLSWFVFLYCLSGYIKLYVLDKIADYKISRFLLVFFIAATCIFLWVLFCNYQYHNGTRIWRNWRYFSDMNNIFTLIASVSLFLVFLKINIGYNKSINIIAGTMLGVYLIHDNRFVRHWLWGNVWGVKDHLSDSFLRYLLWYVFAICLTFLSCVLIEIVRKRIVSRISVDLVRRMDPWNIKLRELFKS